MDCDSLPRGLGALGILSTNRHCGALADTIEGTFSEGIRGGVTIGSACLSERSDVICVKSEVFGSEQHFMVEPVGD